MTYINEYSAAVELWDDVRLYDAAAKSGPVGSEAWKMQQAAYAELKERESNAKAPEFLKAAQRPDEDYPYEGREADHA